ncbi:glycoside hydrolase family 2 TIM barrel-domain containing protein [Pontibacterium sp.]|uniref:glycoside hydrolase family 2 TIM barrel-domain containing protein n=1 Tax=Pontibacterium sp. TaxID=2036026 RepID=UPI00356222E4
MNTLKNTLILSSLGVTMTIQSAYGLPSRLEALNGETDAPQRWQLIVNNQPYQIQGVGCAKAKGANGVDYLHLAKQLGANTVRTWGLTHTDTDYLDRAAELGLQVAVGIWLPHPKAGSLYQTPNSEELIRLRSTILQRVDQLRKHPAVLLWVVGNEVLHAADSPSERTGFLTFLESLVKEIKLRDPDHLVSYAATESVDLQMLNQSAKNLDIIGINLYSDPRKLQRRKQLSGESRPLLFTEFGPRRPEDMRLDELGYPVIPTDQAKAKRYLRRLDQLGALDKQTLGAFVFRLGDPKPDDLHWWNLSYGDNPRAAYVAIAQRYQTGNWNNAPICKTAPSSRIQVAPGESLPLQISEQALSHALYGSHFWPVELRARARQASTLLTPDQISAKPNMRVNVPDQPGDYWLITHAVSANGTACVQRSSLRVQQP